MVILCIPKGNKQKDQITATIAIIAYSVIFGLRYGVGMDYFTYKENFEFPDTITYTEPGFLLALKLFSSVHLSTPFYFGIIAFIQLYFIFLSLKNDKKIYPFLVFSYMAGCIWLSFANCLRQELAFCIFTCSIQLLDSKRPVLYALIILICTSLHSSALLLLILYPFFLMKKDWFTSIKWQILLLIISIGIMNLNLTSSLISKIESLFALTSYNYYLSDDYSELFFNESRIGIGVYINATIEFFLIANSNKVKRYYSKTIFPIIYTLFFIGVLWKYVFWGSQLLQRINFYFYGFEFIIVAFSLTYFYKNNKLSFLLLSFLTLLVFIATMYRMDENTAQYYFYWQQNSYHSYL